MSTGSAPATNLPAFEDHPVGDPSVAVQGYCDPAYLPLARTFVENFHASESGAVAEAEVGAAFTVRHEGRVVLDLWGGVAKDGSAWQADTMSVVFSCTKAATALCAHLLIDRGLLKLDALVSDYWPEFARAGKESVTVRMMLNHTAGVPALREEVVKGGYYDWDYMIERLGAEAPFWTPGTRNGYHMMTFGWTVGELVRRVSGKSLGTFFAQEIAAPLGLDFYIGLPESEAQRVSGMIAWRPKKGTLPTPFTGALIKDPQSLQALALLNSGGHNSDSKAAYAAELGGGGGITNARSLAAFYDPLAHGGRSSDGHQLISEDAVNTLRAVSVATEEDATLLMPTRFGLGFMRSIDNRHRPTGDMETMVLGHTAFGHAGAGGSVGFADPECGLALGYSMNLMGAGILLNQRGQRLVDATYQHLGYRTNVSGAWHR